MTGYVVGEIFVWEGLLNSLIPGIWHNRHEAGEFDCFGYPSLVFVAELVSSTCGNLKLRSDILP